jgi:glycerophosphoryl diester phosphodiesterase
VHPGTHIATLEEVLELVNCYENDEVTLNLETKLDPTTPNQTLPVETYINDMWPVVQKYGLNDRTTIESFDWRTLIGIKAKFPKVQTVALIDPTKIIPDANGKFPWLGGLDLQKQFNGDWVAAAAYINASALSPLHGYPITATQFTPGYTAFTTKNVVDRAHQAGMDVVPWTVDDEVLIMKMIEDGVDAVISNYPERVIWMGARNKVRTGKKPRKHRPECLGKA